MLLPFTNAQLKITGKLASHDYLEITKKMISVFSQGKKYLAKDVYIEPDASSATYFWAAKKLLRLPIEISNEQKKYLQPDALAKTIIQDFPNLPKEISGERFPDAVPTLAVLAAFGKNTVHFTNIANLRVKECDRIHALALNLNRIKPGLAKELGDKLIVHGDPLLWQHGQGARIETFDDHRIAMAFSLAGLRIPGIKISNPDCVAKSFPDYWKTLKRLGIKLI
jgi:3-phosphoshikimate 1-carboxyvinyltransferase